MSTAVAKRPVVPFRTEVTLPEWTLEEPEDAYLGEPDTEPYGTGEPYPPYDDPGVGGLTVDRPQTRDPGPVLDQEWIDRVTGARARDERNAQPPSVPRSDVQPRPGVSDIRRVPPAVPPPAPLPPRDGQQSSTERSTGVPPPRPRLPQDPQP